MIVLVAGGEWRQPREGREDHYRAAAADGRQAVLLSDRIVMMTNGPEATVGEILQIDLPRPRNHLELADNPAYNHYRAEVLKFLYEQHRKPEEQTA